MSAPHEYKESIGTCSACGNSPISHFEAYLFYTISVWTASRRDRTKQSARSGNPSRLMIKAEDILAKSAIHGARTLGILRYSREPSLASTYRSQVIWEEANRRGLPMEQIFVFGKATDLYRAQVGGSWIYFQSLPVPSELATGNSELVDDKFLLKKTLQEHGVPAPIARSASTRAQALEAFDALTPPLVVKPRSGSRGRHTTTNVRTREDLIAAFDSAKQLCRYVAIEEHLQGNVCRATLVAGELVGFFEGKRPSVVGDGRSTIAQLVEKANAAKLDRVQDIVLREENRTFLSRLEYRFDSVPPAGERVDLTHRTGRLFGGETRELLAQVHPKLREYLEIAARAADIPVVGFDLIIEDPQADPDTQRWGIIEGNSLPFIDLHYLPLHGEPSNPAAAVWDLWPGARTTNPSEIVHEE